MFNTYNLVYCNIPPFFINLPACRKIVHGSIIHYGNVLCTYCADPDLLNATPPTKSNQAINLLSFRHNLLFNTYEYIYVIRYSDAIYGHLFRHATRSHDMVVRHIPASPCHMKPDTGKRLIRLLPDITLRSCSVATDRAAALACTGGLVAWLRTAMTGHIALFKIDQMGIIAGGAAPL